MTNMLPFSPGSDDDASPPAIVPVAVPVLVPAPAPAPAPALLLLILLSTIKFASECILIGLILLLLVEIF